MAAFSKNSRKLFKGAINPEGKRALSFDIDQNRNFHSTRASLDIRVEGPSSDNSCINASFDDTVSMTMLISTTPAMADTPVSLGTVAKVGVSISGVPIFADAPSVLDTGHMPALDVCAGHVDPGGWYHYHGTATDLDTIYENTGVQASCANAIQDTKTQFGFAFDGYAIFGSLERDGSVPRDLDALAEAMQAAGRRDADLAAVAATLGITEGDLRAALPRR